MTALAANKERRYGNVDGLKRGFILPTASTQFYEGGLIAIASSGLAVKASDTAGLRVLGVAVATYLSPASGALAIEYEYGHEEWFPIDSALNTAINASLWKSATVFDDQTLSNGATTTNDIPAGEIRRYEFYKGVNGVYVAVGCPSLNGVA